MVEQEYKYDYNVLKSLHSCVTSGFWCQVWLLHGK